MDEKLIEERILPIPESLWEAANDVILQAVYVHRLVSQYRPGGLSEPDRGTVLRLQDAVMSLGLELLVFQRRRCDTDVLDEKFKDLAPVTQIEEIASGCPGCHTPVIEGVDQVAMRSGTANDGLYHLECWTALKAEADLHAKE